MLPRTQLYESLLAGDRCATLELLSTAPASLAHEAFAVGAVLQDAGLMQDLCLQHDMPGTVPDYVTMNCMKRPPVSEHARMAIEAMVEDPACRPQQLLEWLQRSTLSEEAHTGRRNMHVCYAGALSAQHGRTDLLRHLVLQAGLWPVHYLLQHAPCAEAMRCLRELLPAPLHDTPVLTFGEGGRPNGYRALTPQEAQAFSVAYTQEA